MIGDAGDNLAAATVRFHRQVVAEPEELVALRQDLRRWVAKLGMDVEQQEDVVLASYEAMANSAEHAYLDDTTGLVDVHATRIGSDLTVTVTDRGMWKKPDRVDPFRGRGLALIRALADTTDVDRGTGTTVTMTWTV